MKNLSNFIIRLIPPSFMLSLFYFGVIENIQWVSTTFFTLFYISVSFCVVVYIFRAVLINKVSISVFTNILQYEHNLLTYCFYYLLLPWAANIRTWWLSRKTETSIAHLHVVSVNYPLPELLFALRLIAPGPVPTTFLNTLAKAASLWYPLCSAICWILCLVVINKS